MGSSTGPRTPTVPSRPTEKHDRGIFRCAPADLADPTKHTLLFNAEFEMANMIIEDGVILAGHCAPASTYETGIAFSPDMGKTWARVRPGRVRAAISRPLPPEKQRRLVPRGPAQGMDRAGGGPVHQAEADLS